VFIDQFVSLASKDDTEIVKTVDDPFEFATGGQLYNDMDPVPPDPVEKLILHIDLILHHGSLPSSPSRDFRKKSV
jgi:hypothetical protein